MPSYRSLRNLGFGVFAAVPLSLMLAGKANATPYAFASNIDSRFNIVATSGSYVANTATASFSSANGASINGVGTATNDSGNTGANALQATAGPGPFPAQDTYTQALKVSGTGARADSISGGFQGTGANVAEGNLTGFGVGSDAAGAGQISSTNTAALTLVAGAGVTLNVSFNDAILLEAATSATTGESANSAITSTVTVENSSGAIVFEFAPTGGGPGSTSAVKNGTVVSDPFSLNAGITSASGNPADIIVSNSGFFSATSNALPAGTYTVLISQEARMDLAVGTPTATPEPASLALLGAGLVGLGVLRRKKTTG